MITFECRHCMTVTTEHVRLDKREARRCSNCGEMYWVGEGNPATPMYPALRMRPIDTVSDFGVVSPWMLPRFRPVLPGWYDCRFTHLEPERVRLWWNGYRFTVNGRCVDMRGFLSFRGVLAP